MTTARRWLDVTPLLGRPYAEADCGAIAQAALALAGIEVPDAAFARLGRDREDALAAYLDGTALRWLELGSAVENATEIGDVIVARSDEDARAHLLVLTDPAMGLAVTTTERSGCQCIRIRRLRGTLRVIRWIPA